MDYNIITTKTISANGMGSLSFIEGMRDVPFEIKRIYYIHGCPKGVHRGGHAHIKLTQMLFCPYGKIEIILDDGTEKSSIILDDPRKALIIGPGLWRDMIWHKKDSVLCVAASEYYDEKDYIRDYDAFLCHVREVKRYDRVY